MSRWFLKLIAAIFALPAAVVSQAADAKTALPALKAELRAQGMLEQQARLLSPRWVYAWRLPPMNAERGVPQTTREMFDLHFGKRLEWDMALEAIPSEDVFSERYRKTRLIITIEGVVFDPNDSRYWFSGLGTPQTERRGVAS
jgi:hypothetical protein